MPHRTVIEMTAVLCALLLLQPDGAWCFKRSSRHPESARGKVSKSARPLDLFSFPSLDAPLSLRNTLAVPFIEPVSLDLAVPWDPRMLGKEERPDRFFDSKSFYQAPPEKNDVRGGMRAGGSPAEPIITRIPSSEGSWRPSTSFGIGGTYASTRNCRRGHTALDLFVPVWSEPYSALFLQLHGQFPNAEFGAVGGPSRRSGVSVGLGWRRSSPDNYLYGVNLFFDGVRIGKQLHGSGSLGLEYALLTSSSPKRLFDFSFNMYLGGGVEAEMGYSSELTPWLDARLFLAKTRFFDGEYLLGWRGGLDLTGPHRLIGVRYEYGQDRINPYSHSVMAYLSVPFKLDNLLRGKSPIEFPRTSTSRERFVADAVSANVRRTWRQPSSAIMYRSQEGGIWHAPGETRFWDDESRTKSYMESSQQLNLLKYERAQWCEQNPRCCSEEERKAAREDTAGLMIGGLYVSQWITAGLIFVCEAPYRYLFGPFEMDKRSAEKPRR